MLGEIDAGYRPPTRPSLLEVVTGGTADVEEPHAGARRRARDRCQMLAPPLFPTRVAGRTAEALELIPGRGRVSPCDLLAVRHRIDPHEPAAGAAIEPPSIFREQVARFAAAAQVASYLHPCVPSVVLVILHAGPTLDTSDRWLCWRESDRRGDHGRWLKRKRRSWSCDRR